jgi:uncharacterized membrane protein
MSQPQPVQTEIDEPELATARVPSRAFLLGLILGLYFVARIVQVLPFSTPSTPIVALGISCALAFAFVHGSQHYRIRGILVFAALCLIIGNIAENIGVLTGFPYGRYEFLPLMGPQILHVPILLGLAYIGMAYASWTLARLILRATQPTPSGAQLIAVPLAAAVIMTAWDFAQDPVWSTLLHAWLWHDGGRWFGVPLTNYAGWLLTVFLIYFAFALYLRRRSAAVQAPAHPYWRTAVFLYALCALGNALQLLRPQPSPFVFDAAGKLWDTRAILIASALVSVFIMGSFAVVAWVRIPQSSDVSS